MKYSDTISHNDELDHDKTHQKIIQTGNSYQKTEWQDSETYTVQWYSLKMIKL